MLLTTDLIGPRPKPRRGLGQAPSASSRIVDLGKSMRQVPVASPDEQDPFFGDVPWPVDTSRGSGLYKETAGEGICV